MNLTTTTAIYTLSLHDALPISERSGAARAQPAPPLRILPARSLEEEAGAAQVDRKSTRLNSSHSSISYAVFCLKKKKDAQQFRDRRLTEGLAVRQRQLEGRGLQ